MTLPKVIQPMLAKSSQPFDSDEFLFEIKWDGIRLLAFLEQGNYRLLSRQGHEVTNRFRGHHGQALDELLSSRAAEQ